MTTKMSDEEIVAAHEAEEACLKWFDIAEKRDGKSSVKWLQNNETGCFMIFTKGDYSEHLKQCVKNLSIGDY